jgi:thiol:disulfide interchange protein DsbD
MRNTFLSFICLLLAATCVSAQNPAKWSLQSDVQGKKLTANLNFKAALKADIESGWHLYALEQPTGGPIATTISVTKDKPFSLDGKIDSPEPKTKFDPNFNIDTKYFENSVTFAVPLRSTVDTAGDELSLDVRFQLCNDTFCLPPKTVRVTFAGVEDVKKTSVGNQQSTAANSANSPNAPNSINSPNSLWGFIWLAITLGALSLLTPCVFPMIPITVSYFTNHSAGHRSKAVKLATVYSLGIIATFTLLGMLLAVFVGAAGINLFAANPWINLLITGVFLFFAFNLFGAYEITVPTKILTRLDALTRSREGEGSGIVGALLMGLTFTLTSFTCTSPFVGTLLVSASQGNWQMPLVGMLAFSSVFALPFFVLALLPQYISQLPRAGGWMNSVKVAMGFLEVAASMKFLSNVDLVWKWGIFTRDVVLAVWIAIGVILAFYLLGKFQLAHDSKPERIGAFRLLSAVVSLAISFYLLTGLFGAKLGELESFLPPDLSNSSSRLISGGKNEPMWIVNDFEAGLAKAKAENKRMFIDFTGYTCTNCRWMEANIFPKKEVEDELNKFVLVRLYTDGEGAVFEKHLQMEQDMFGTVALPYYAVVDASGKTVGSFPGLTRNTQEFVDFLKKAQEN